LVLLALLACSVSFAMGVIEREAAVVGAVDRALEASFRWVVPLLCFAVASQVFGSRRLPEAVWCEARLGRSRRPLAVGLLSAAALGAALLALGAVGVVVLTSAVSLSAVVRELWTCAWITALGACAYVAWFGAGALFFRSGAGRAAVLVLDFLLGETNGMGALLWPRAHLRNLLGGSPPLDQSQLTATVSLVAIVVLLLAVVSWRTGR
jgi:hypothetical protein